MKRWLIALYAVALLAVGHVAYQPAEAGLITQAGSRLTVPPTPSDDPYLWYPALNLNTIPWHTASGAWGPQVQIVAPAAPVTTRQVSVDTLSEFIAESGTPGTEITITAGWDEFDNVAIAASDIDVIINPGVSVGGIEVGLFPRTTPIARIRIRGPTIGAHSGGRMGQYRDAEQSQAGGITDVIIDGIDLNGSSVFTGAETNQAFRVGATRMAVVNCRVIAPGYTWLGGVSQLVIANTNFYHGGATRAAVGFVEGWGIRNVAGPITIFQSRIQGTRYHNIRAQSVGGSGELLFISESTLVAMAEGRTAWMWNNLNNPPFSDGQGAIIQNTGIYTYSNPTCGLGPDISAANVEYSRVQNNSLFGAGDAVMDQSYLNTQAAAGGGSPGDHDWSVGNTFATLTAFPAWGGPGDPTAVPLPTGFTLITGEGDCPGFVP